MYYLIEIKNFISNIKEKNKKEKEKKYNISINDKKHEIKDTKLVIQPSIEISSKNKNNFIKTNLKNNCNSILGNVSSKYIVKNIFSFIDENKKLNIIKNSKYFQNTLGISLEDIKNKSGKIKFIGNNGEGKEYTLNYFLIFSGKYLNGKRNGKGKEYDGKSHLIFEGEYLKGERNGKGKEYNEFHSLLYEGEYLKGKRNGIGRENDAHGHLLFEGEFLNGKRWNGKGYDFSKKEVYKLKNGKGKVKEYDYSEYFDCDDITRRVSPSNEPYLKFEGEYLNGERNGKGKEYYTNGKIKFEGDYLNGKRNGKGKEYWLHTGKLKFEGEYKNGKRKGKGEEYMIFSNTLQFEGGYLYDYKIKGKYYVNEKLEYEGEYLYNKKWNGKGYDENGNILFISVKLLVLKFKFNSFNDEHP